MIAHGVAITSVLTPQAVSFKTLHGVILYPYLNAFGNIDYTVNQTDRKYYSMILQFSLHNHRR